MRYIVCVQKTKIFSYCGEYNESTSCSSNGGIAGGNYADIEVGIGGLE